MAVYELEVFNNDIVIINLICTELANEALFPTLPYAIFKELVDDTVESFFNGLLFTEHTNLTFLINLASM